MLSTTNEEPNDNISDPTIEALNALLDITSNPQDFLHTILLPPSNQTNKEHLIQVESLRLISKELFSRLEQLASLNEKIDNLSDQGDNDDDDHDGVNVYPLSGLSELYTGDIIHDAEAKDNNDNQEEYKIDVDSETIFSQVDIQNEALFSKVKKIVKNLSKKIDKNGKSSGDVVRLLNMQEMDEENSSVESDLVDNKIGEGEEEQNEDEDDIDENSEDEEARRIRLRMERSMAEMDGMSEEDGSEGEDEASMESESDKKLINDEDEQIDPWRESLNDGFFDLHEMERFADEEEEMLPDAAFGKPEQEEEPLEKRKKALPHLRSRGGIEDDEVDEDDAFNSLEKLVEIPTMRKRFREDEDIKALENMYDLIEDSDDEEDEMINMTAADIFGPPKKPSKEFLESSKKIDKTKKVTFDDDDDSWNDHDFSAEGNDWRDREYDGDEIDEKDMEDDEMNAEDDNEDFNHDEEDTGRGHDKSLQHLSNYTKRNTKLKEMTEELEKDLLAEKPWQMVGEAKGTQRPTNSLLEVTPTFEVATKMAPIITVEHTLSIEEIIKKRILAEDWDDVIPRELPDIGLSKRNGELPEVSQEKSKLSLGELYEREYLKKVTGYDADTAEKETEEEKAKNEMKMLFANLCSKLDALSNYHFAPRPVADEAVVKSSATPAVAMEEILPLHVSDAQAMAPEEIYAKKDGRDGLLRGESELDQVSCDIISFFFVYFYVPMY